MVITSGRRMLLGRVHTERAKRHAIETCYQTEARRSIWSVS